VTVRTTDEGGEVVAEATIDYRLKPPA